jgi:hypothetical protein
VTKVGRPSMLPELVEKVIVDIVLTMAKIRHPLCVQEIIELANSVVEKTVYEDQVKAWKIKHNRDFRDDETFKLGHSWWHGFSQRNKHLLVVKRGAKFASNRSEWSKYIYISQMYDEIYKNMLSARIAVALPHPVFMDAEGNIVANAEENLNFEIDVNQPNRPLGLACDIKVTHPEHLLFFDETGCNTNHKKDGHFTGQKFACGRGMTPKQICSTRDRHFTVLGLTASSGDPVLCVVIFASDKTDGVIANWTEGIDIMVDPVKDENGEIDLSDINFGKGKIFHLAQHVNSVGKRFLTCPCPLQVVEFWPSYLLIF